MKRKISNEREKREVIVENKKKVLKRQNILVWCDFLLTELASSFLLASPTVLIALSTSLCPGRQFTLLFRAWDTALATCTQPNTFK